MLGINAIITNAISFLKQPVKAEPLVEQPQAIDIQDTYTPSGGSEPFSSVLLTSPWSVGYDAPKMILASILDSLKRLNESLHELRLAMFGLNEENENKCDDKLIEKAKELIARLQDKIELAISLLHIDPEEAKSLIASISSDISKLASFVEKGAISSSTSVTLQIAFANVKNGADASVYYSDSLNDFRDVLVA